MTDPETRSCNSLVEHPAVRRSLRAALAVAAACVLAGCGPTGEKLLARAEQSAAGGDFRAAMIDLQNYLTKHPDDPNARARLAVVMTELENYPGAKTEVDKAKQLGAAPEKTILAECRIMLEEREYARALDECAPQTKDTHLAGSLASLRGSAQLSLGHPADARKSFAEALSVNPSDLGAIAGAAQAEFLTNGLVAARGVFDQAPRALRARTTYWRALGDLEQRAGDLNTAQKSYETALSKSNAGEENRDRLFALLGLADVQLSLGNKQDAKATGDRLLAEFPKQPEAKFARARIARTQGDLAQARALLEDIAASLAEPYPRVEYELGTVLELQGNLNQAEEHYAAAVLRDQDNPAYQIALMRLRNRSGAPGSSLETLRPAVDRPDADPSNLVLASELALQQGNRDEALRYLSRAQASAKASTPEAQVNIATGYIAAGDLDRAIAILDAMPAGSLQVESKRNALTLVTLLRQNKTKEAVQRAEQMVKESSDEVAARNLAGSAFLAAREFDLARDQFMKVVEAHPDDQAARVSLARLELQADRPDAAAQHLQAVLAKDATNLAATAGMVIVARMKKDPDGEERWARKAVKDHADAPEAHTALAQVMLERRKPAEAVKSAREAVRLAPDNAAAYSMLGVAQISSGDVDAGVASFRSAVDKAPKAVGYRLNLARGYAYQRKTTEALAAVDEALNLEPKYVPGLAIGAAVSLRSGAVERATGYVERLTAAAPGSVVALKLEGDLAMAQKRYRDAAGFYDRVAAKVDDSALTIVRFEAARRANLKEPQKVLRERLDKHPDDVAVRLVYAEHLERSGDSRAAAHEYETILDKQPKNVIALNNLAVIYQKQHDARAEQLARTAYDAAPDNPMIADTYGWLLVDRGETVQAVGILRKAAAHPAATPEIQYHLAAALARKGDRDEAIEVLRKVTTAPSAGPENVKADASRLLAELER